MGSTSGSGSDRSCVRFGFCQSGTTSIFLPAWRVTDDGNAFAANGGFGGIKLSIAQLSCTTGRWFGLDGIVTNVEPNYLLEPVVLRIRRASKGI